MEIITIAAFNYDADVIYLETAFGYTVHVDQQTGKGCEPDHRLFTRDQIKGCLEGGGRVFAIEYNLKGHPYIREVLAREIGGTIFLKTTDNNDPADTFGDIPRILAY